ncbi:MAG: Hsp20/alpha crystallin family protein [Deltaproteobacteria bacterium]|nr:Hsp20/alpha crystallin family protein [Deltaproteobacteria bacterium]
MTSLLPMRRSQRRESLLPTSSFALDPLRTMLELMQGMQGFEPFGDVDMPGIRGGEMMFQPAFDLKETIDGYHLRADLPGVKASDIDVSVVGNRLTISGKRETEERREGETWHAIERNYGTFMRTVTLPEGANVDDVKASMVDGVLELTIPKSPDVQPRKVQITTTQKQPDQISASKDVKKGNGGGEARR